MKAQFKRIMSFVLVLCMIIPMAVFSNAATEPTVTVDNFKVTVTDADDIKDMRYALGEYTTVAEIKAAVGNVALSNSLVVKYTTDGIFRYEMPEAGYYTIWIRMKDGTNYIKPLDVTDISASVSSYGVMITLHDLYDIKDFFIAKGEYNTYREIKNDGYLFSATAEKLGTKRQYTYTAKEPGIHTVLIRYNDGTQKIFHEILKVDEPVFTKNGLQVIVSNIPDVKVIRTAYGTWNTVKELKATDTIRNFSSKTAIKGKDPYTIQYREEGRVTVIVEYNNGYLKLFHYDVDHREPTVTQDQNTVSFGSLDGLKVIRYAEGVYNSSNDIKNAEGSQYIRSEAAFNGVITVELKPGTYSFCVQYDDESFNYYVITIDCTDHVWGDWVVTTKPTYKTEGEETSECILCGETRTRVVPMLVCSHSFCDWYETKPATEEVEGEERRSCFVCGAVETRVIPKLDPVFNPTATGVKVSNAFSDNMILQRDEKLSVWGTANANSGRVVVELGGKYAVAEVDSNGNWKAEFEETFSYTTEGQPLTVNGADTEIIFDDVLIGDVYYAVGQSNMFYSLGELAIDLNFDNRLSELEIDYDDSRNMRFFRVSNTDYMDKTGTMAQGTTTLYTDVYNGESWMTPSDIENQMKTYASFNPPHQLYDRDGVSKYVFSAIGYIFAYQMSCNTDVPVGVIEIDASGHPLITFAPNELADKWGDDKLDGETGTYYYSMDTLSATHLKSRYAYNQQIYPLSNFSCAGIIWYQGESDWYNTREYHGRGATTFADQFAELMTYFRNTFGNDDFPVYIFEYATCYSNNGANSYMDFGSVKTELCTLPQKLSNCHIVPSSDLWFNKGWLNNVHPYIKHLNASRLTDIVLADKFGVGDLELVSGPVLDSVSYGTTNATLKFKNVGSGLKTADGTSEIRGIEIMVNTTGIYEWRDATGEMFLGKDRIIIDSKDQIFGVRYNRNPEHAFPYQLNLCNSHGMPSIAFVNYKVNPKQAGLESGIVRDGKPKKYFTLAFDDGVTQDARIIEILKKYNAEHSITFYINTGLLGVESDLTSLGVYGVQHKRFNLNELSVYKGFDVGVHTLNHPGLNLYDRDPMYQKIQVEGDAINIENITGYQPMGMAYPGGDQLVSRITVKNILENTPIRYARGITSTGSFELPTNFMMWQPTCHIMDGNLFTYANWFLKTNVPKDQLFFVWGHGYEFDQFSFYDEFEKLIKMMSERDDVVLVTNSEFYQLFKNEIPSTY